jgi:hypothetical protein
LRLDLTLVVNFCISGNSLCRRCNILFLAEVQSTQRKTIFFNEKNRYYLCVLCTSAREKFCNFMARVVLIPGLAESYIERSIFRPPGDIDTRMGTKAPRNKIPEAYTS